MNTPVSFELAKLLKEKGFKLRVNALYSKEGILYKLPTANFRNSNQYLISYGVSILNPVSAPTIAEVVMWLYEKHGIWITVWSAYNNSYKFSYGVLHRKNIVVFHETNFDEKDSPTEAYEAAIKYCLTKLI